MADLRIRTQKNSKGIAVVLLNGTVDAYSYSQLEETLNNLLEKHVYKFVVDLSEVDYLSSAGAGVFIGILGEVQENHGDIILVNPQRGVRDVFELLGLTQIFKITQDKKTAVGRFN